MKKFSLCVPLICRFSTQKTCKTLSVLGANLHFGQSHQGVAQGPTILRATKLVEKLENKGYHVQDNGNILDSQHVERTNHREEKTVSHVKNTREVGDATLQIASFVKKDIVKDNLPITIGGDHSIAIGSISGVLQGLEAIYPTNLSQKAGDACVVWVDAHADLNTPRTTTSGNLHGMVLSFLLNLETSRALPGFEWLQNSPILNPSRLIYIGLRDVDPPENVFIQQHKIKAYRMNDIRKLGLPTVMKYVCDYVHSLSTLSTLPHVHLSFDIDAVDPFYAPATGTPVKNGLSDKEACYIGKTLKQTGFLKSMDLVEINPNMCLDQGKTAQLAVKIVQSCF